MTYVCVLYTFGCKIRVYAGYWLKNIIVLYCISLNWMQMSYLMPLPFGGFGDATSHFLSLSPLFVRSHCRTYGTIVIIIFLRLLTFYYNGNKAEMAGTFHAKAICFDCRWHFCPMQFTFVAHTLTFLQSSSFCVFFSCYLSIAATCLLSFRDEKIADGAMLQELPAMKWAE